MSVTNYRYLYLKTNNATEFINTHEIRPEFFEEQINERIKLIHAIEKDEKERQQQYKQQILGIFE